MKRMNLLKRTMAVGIAAAMAVGMVGCSKETTEATAVETIAETETQASLTVDQTALEVSYGTTVVFTDGSGNEEEPTDVETTAAKTAAETTAEETEAPAGDAAEETEAETEGETEAVRALEPIAVQVTAEGIDSWEVTVAEIETEEETTAAETETAETAEVVETEEETETAAETEEETKTADPMQAYEINGMEVTFQLPGVYEVTVSGGELTAVVEVTVIDDVAPVITAPENLEVEAGDSEFDFLAEVSAVDEIDGDLTDMIEVNTENAVLDEAGETSVVYTVKDAAGNAAEVEVPVTVVEAEGGNNSGSGSGTSSGNGGNTTATEPAGQTGNETVDNNEGTINPATGEKMTYDECKAIFDSLTTDMWDFYWDFLDEDLQEALTADEYNQLKAYVDAGIAEAGGSGGGSTEEQPASEPYFDDTMAKEALSYVNSYRTNNGLTELVWDDTLYEAAKIRAQELVNSFSHTRPNGTNFSSILSEVGLSMNVASGENIAGNYTSASEVVDAWYASEGHRNNMLNSNYGKTAIACYFQDGNYYWVNLFISNN